MLTIEDQDFLINLSDLAVLADALGARSNTLSMVPPAQPVAGQRERALSEFRRLDPQVQKRLSLALGVLTAPAKAGDLHHAIADETVSRAVLAWSANHPDTIVTVTGTQDPRRIGLWTQGALTASVRKILAAEKGLHDDLIGCRVTTPAALVFLAALDQLRAARLHSMLSHAAPMTLFSPEELEDRLRDAASEDFRWPLTFVEKIIPGGLVTSLTPAEVAAALDELAGTGVIEAVSTNRYEMSGAGQVMADGILHDVSKLALGVTAPGPDGQLGRDVVLLIRGGFHLFLFALAGQEAVMAAVNIEELDEVLHRMLYLNAWRPPVILPPAAGITCPHCGNRLVAESLFCNRCGASLSAAGATPPPASAVVAPVLPPIPTPAAASAQVCPRCQRPQGPGMKFCTSCGASLLSVCTRCAAPVASGTRFCTNCGNPAG